MTSKKTWLVIAMAGVFAACSGGSAENSNASTSAGSDAQAAAVAPANPSDTPKVPGSGIAERLAKYGPVQVDYDGSILSADEKEALRLLVKAGAVMDEIFMEQVYAGNKALKDQLARVEGMDKAEAKALRKFFAINFGPWDRLEEDQPFWGNTPKPAGAGYYPEDMTKEEFNTHVAANPGDKDAFEGYFTRIDRADDGGLKATPYNEAYKAKLVRAAAFLYQAADKLEKGSPGSANTDYTTLARFLRSRADAFSSNNYFQSDMDWMDVEHNIIDVTIGPYEVYEDGLFAYKAAFEAFIAIRNPADSQALDRLKGYLPAMERNLPIEDKFKNFSRGTDSPISVVDLVYAGGDTKAGVQTLAFNLPNDERVREAKGSKKVMLKNISQAKYDQILQPIAQKLLDPSQQPLVTFDAYFSNVLMHELSHGLGPGTITLADGSETTVNQALQTLYSPLEEAKADIMGLYNKEFLAMQGYLKLPDLKKAYVSFLPGFFRAIRFGATSAHGKANMMEYNYCKEQGAILYDEATGRFKVDLNKMPGAVRNMTRDLCMIQALGDYDKAKAFIDKYSVMPTEVENALKGLTDIPVDIVPSYSAERFLREQS